MFESLIGHALMNKLRRLPSALYIIVLKSLRLQASTRIRFRCVLKSFHSGDRFQTFAATVCVFVGYVWTQGRNKMFAHKNESGYAWTRRTVFNTTNSCIYRVSQKNGNRTLACYRPFNI